MMIGEVKRAFSENKWAIIVSIAILFISLILGYVLEPNLYDYFNPVVDDFTQKVDSGVIQLTFQDIFFNNFRIICQMFIYGIIFCFSALILAFNGFFVGYYVATTENLYYTLLLIIPHGIFEFSSCILACAGGFVLFNFMYKFLKTFWKYENESASESFRVSFIENFDKLKQALIIFAVAAILMVIAGFVEVYLTVPIANYIIG
ncbi:stage II sporulation protein M [uncultured Methanobrevibacter sp.]|uniref:stage II sporulation protein M n=1 Tax=uncultured Methanobrevibacter sp. TaxID=253161 RepID=UPI00261610CE|nr:stage II sporulation protein M [uncultured Methanobrevibacter sp.]